VVAAAALVAVAPPAGADCSGPTIEYEAGEVDPSAVVTIVGTAWGDNCYDTGPPPPGEGVLGHPVEVIDVFAVQGAEEVLVAEGGADREYEFEVDVTVPSTFEPGEMAFEARWGPDNERVAFLNVAAPLVVTDAAGDPALDDVATFGPPVEEAVVEEEGEGAGEEATGEPADDDDGDDGGIPTWVLVGVGLALAAVLGGVLFTRTESVDRTKG
jgi:hypothetical protein